MPASSEWLYAFDNDKNLRIRQKHAKIIYDEMRSRLKVSECHALLDGHMRQLIYESLKIGRRPDEIFYPENLDSEEEVDVESEDDVESTAGSAAGSAAGTIVVAQLRVFPPGFRQKQWYTPLNVCEGIEADEEDYWSAA